MSEPSGAPPEGDRSDPAPPEEEQSAEDTTPGSPVTEAPPTNLARLQKQYEAAREDRRETIPIAPGIYDGNLAALYHPIEWSDTRKKIAKLQRKGATDEQALNFAASTLVKACETIMFRPDDDSDFVPMAEAAPELAQGSTIRFDSRLARALGIKLSGGENGAAICRLVFVEPHILDSHFQQFDFWLRGLTPGDDDEDEEIENVGDRPT